MKELLCIKNFEQFIERVPIIKGKGEKGKRPKPSGEVERLILSKRKIASHFDITYATLLNWMRRSGYVYLIEDQPIHFRKDYKQIKEDTKGIDKIIGDVM